MPTEGSSLERSFRDLVLSLRSSSSKISMAVILRRLKGYGDAGDPSGTSALGKDYDSRDTTANITKELPDWVQEIVAATSKDTRKQPWRATLPTPVDSRLDNGPDLVTIKKTSGAQPDPLCPFRTQGSSLAA
ncbi:MAG: hypothetical protein Q9167_005550 [Letrouitia subvulpina]